jgi:hypothetical protein
LVCDNSLPVYLPAFHGNRVTSGALDHLRRSSTASIARDGGAGASFRAVAALDRNEAIWLDPTSVAAYIGRGIAWREKAKKIGAM